MNFDGVVKSLIYSILAIFLREQIVKKVLTD